jgi:hypothetical protein
VAGTITDDVNRDALLRMIELKIELSDLANEYRDLGAGCVGNLMVSVAHEFLASAYLPTQYRAPSPDVDQGPRGEG